MMFALQTLQAITSIKHRMQRKLVCKVAAEAQSAMFTVFAFVSECSCSNSSALGGSWY